MENLNAETVKKVLEHCANWIVETGCKGCPIEKNCTDIDITKEALALINSQEQRIKELTEENERLQAEITHLEGHREADIKAVKNLKAENERLHASCTELTRKCASLNDENERLRAERDTFEIYYKDYKYRYGELQKDNRRWAEEYDELNRVNESLIENIAKAKADTVRKMRERFKTNLHNTAMEVFGHNRYYLIGEQFIDQIAKEIQEEA